MLVALYKLGAPIPQVSHSTISLGVSESSRLHLIQMMSVVVSSTVGYNKDNEVGVRNPTMMIY